MKKVGKVIAYVFVVLLFVGGMGLIVVFTNGGTTDFKTFYVQSGNTIYADNTNEISIGYTPVHFETKYLFASNKEESHKGYKIKIVPHVSEKTNFDFTVDGQAYFFGAESDLTAAFNIEYGKTGFTLDGNGVTMQNVLQTIYRDKTVVTPELDIRETVYFDLVVSAYNDSQSIIIGLRFGCYIELSTDSIVF